jgi:segregation and condensation protein A
MDLQPISIETELAALPVGAAPDFTVQLPVFEGPLQLLLHLIESRQLDILTVSLAELADGYVTHLARHPVDAANLAEFVAIAAQLIYLKSRRLLPTEPLPAASGDDDEPSEEELRRRLLEYRALRDAARQLGTFDLVAPAMRREPRDSDLPAASAPVLPASLLVAALDRLAVVAEPVEPPPQVMARELTIGMQIGALRQAMGDRGRVVLQAVLATCRSRTEAAVTLLAALELVRRRQVTASQDELFGPITLEAVPGSAP